MIPSELNMNDTNNNIFNQSNNDMNLINQDYQRKVNINNLFTRPIDLCFSNNRFTGALLIPEFKYNKLSTRNATSSTSAPVVSLASNEFALFSVANRNCLRLISLPEGDFIFLKPFSSLLLNPILH